jgi:annexin A7/11
VEALYKAGTGRAGTDETEFIRLLNTRNYNHLAQVFNAYAAKYGQSVGNVVKKEFGGKLEQVLLAAVRVAENRGDYFAELLESSMKGVGTDEGNLCRIFLFLHSCIDKLNRLVVRLRGTPSMQSTRDAYMKRHGKSLENRIKGETSGDHEKLLVALVNQPVW